MSWHPQAGLRKGQGEARRADEDSSPQLLTAGASGGRARLLLATWCLPGRRKDMRVVEAGLARPSYLLEIKI